MADVRTSDHPMRFSALAQKIEIALNAHQGGKQKPPSKPACAPFEHGYDTASHS